MAVFAWVLVVGFGMNWGLTIPAIVSEKECQRLGDAIQAGAWAKTSFTCHRYQIVR